MKLVSFVLGIGLSALLIGCGGGGSSSASDDGGAVSSDPAVALTRTAYTTAENVSDAVTLQSDTAGTLFTIVGGFDSDKLRIDSSTGKLTFLTTPDFENPHDQNADNIFELTIKLTAPGSETMTGITIRVLDVDESGGGAADTGPDPDVSEVVEIPVWDERPEVTIPDPADPLEGGSFTYLGDRLALPDGLTIDDVFVDDIRLKQNYKIVASANAVTVDNYTGENQNDQDAGRYLIAGKTDIEHQALITFDRNDIENTFGGETQFDAVRDKISRVELYLWAEKGTDAALEIQKLARSLDENSAVWQSNWGFDTMTTYTFFSEPKWYKVEIPVDTLLFWMDNPAAFAGLVLKAASGNGNGHYVQFSSDETSRPPSLVIHYADVTEPTLAPYAADTVFDPESCEISYEVSPPNPAAGERVTVTATATDNRAMDYVAIKHRDDTGVFHTVAYNHTDGIQNSLSVSYETTAELPNLKFAIKADDEAGMASSHYQYVQVPVRNSGEGPEVIVEEAPEVTEVYPKSYRFIKADQQKVELSFKATDPDGITKAIVNIGGREFRTFNYDGSDTVVNETMTWQNDPSYTKYNYRIQVFDKSGDYTVVDSAEEYPILDYSQLALYKNALNFPNDRGKDKLTYDPYMFYTYGEPETKPRIIWPGAVLMHEKYVKRIAKKGLCYGMSATAIELARRDHLRVENFKSTAIHPSDLTQSDSLVNKYLYTKQASQFSLEGLFMQSLNYFARLTLSALTSIDRAEYVLNQVKSALNDSPYKLGILSVSQFDLSIIDEDGKVHLPSGMKAHAIVPWMVRKIGEDEWRIYVYDPNKPMGPTNLQKIVYELDGEGYMSFANIDLFPYVSIDNDTGKWSYVVNGETWSTLIQYTGSHTVSGGGIREFNTIDEDHNLYTRDYDLPTIGGVVSSIVGGLMRLVVNSASTDMTVSYSTASAAVPRDARQQFVMPVPLADADLDNQMYLLQSDSVATVKITGKQNDTYDVSLDIGRTAFAISEKAIQTAQSDYLTVDSSMEEDGFNIVIAPSTSDSDFNITAVFTYGKLVAGTIIPASKKYTLSHVNMNAGSEMIFDLQTSANVLSIRSEKNTVSFDIRVEESLNDAETVETIYAAHVSVDPQTPFSFNFTAFSMAD